MALTVLVAASGENSLLAQEPPVPAGNAQPVGNADGVTGLWEKAVKSPNDYLESRTSLLTRGAEIVPFLQGQLKSPQPKRRWLAKALLARAADPQGYSRRDAAFEELLKNYTFVLPGGASRKPRLNEALLAGQAKPFPGFETAEAVPFLMEIFYGSEDRLRLMLAVEALVRLQVNAIPALMEAAHDNSLPGVQTWALSTLLRIQAGTITPAMNGFGANKAAFRDERIVDTWFDVLKPETLRFGRSQALAGIVQLRDPKLLDRLSALRATIKDEALGREIDVILDNRDNLDGPYGF